MSNFFYTTMRPAMYHGHGKRAPFFEGWYYKLVSADEQHRYAVIPGVMLGENGHAFIQVLNGSSGASTYHRFPLEKFWASRQDFEVRIGSSRFTVDGLTLQVDSSKDSIHGDLQFEGILPWPVSWTSPGIMGWYAWVPFMETYHGVLSLDHRIEGKLEIGGQAVDFSGGRGYIEKDWGQAFPEAYVWFQSNHFETPETSITASVAIIPWLGSAFRGFIVGLWHQGQLYRMATYTKAKIKELEISDVRVRWALQDKHYTLEMTATREQGGLLRGPSREDMGRRVEETMQAVVEARLISKDGTVVFKGQGCHAGLEVNGDLERLLSFA
jgi:hypothetical protein